MNTLILIVTLLGNLQVTSYRSVPNQTDNSPYFTSIGERVHPHDPDRARMRHGTDDRIGCQAARPADPRRAERAGRTRVRTPVDHEPDVRGRETGPEYHVTNGM